MPFATQITKGNRYCPPFPRFTHLRTSAPAPSPPCPALSPTSPLHWKLEPHQLQSHQHQHFIASSHHPPPASGKGGETLFLFRLFPSPFGWQFELMRGAPVPATWCLTSGFFASDLLWLLPGAATRHHRWLRRRPILTPFPPCGRLGRNAGHGRRNGLRPVP